MAKDYRSSVEKVTGGAVSVTIAVVISRILGLVREQVLAFFFGAGKEMDAYVVAYRIPNLLRDLFAEGALGSAFAKTVSSQVSKESLNNVLKRSALLVSNWMTVVSLFVLLGIIFTPELVGLIAPAFKESPDKFSLTTELTRIMMPFLLFISLSAILAGTLNALGYFFVPAISSALFNLSSILIGVGGYYLLSKLGYEPIYAIALGVTIGGLVQALSQYSLLKRMGFCFQLKIDFSLQEFRETLRLILPVVVGLSAVQLNVFINTFFATSCGDGAVSWYNYAFRVMYVPLGLFGVGLAQALLPELTTLTSKNNLNSAKETFEKVLIVSLSLSMPSAIGLFILSEEIITLLFERGNFTKADTLWTAKILSILALSLPFYSLSKATIPLFYALNKTIFTTLASFMSVLINLTVILLTIENFGILGVALGTLGSLIGQAIFLLSIAYYFLKGLNLKYFGSALATLIISSIFLILSIWVVKSLIDNSYFRVIVSIPLGAVVFMGICKLFGIRETYIFYYSLLKKLRFKEKD